MTTESPDNVVPVEEMNRRRRVNELADQIVDLWRDLGERVRELREMQVPTETWMEVASTRFNENNVAERLHGGLPVLSYLVDLIMKFGERNGPSSEPMDWSKIMSGATWGVKDASFSPLDWLGLATRGIASSFPQIGALMGLGKDPGPPPEPLEGCGLPYPDGGPAAYIGIAALPMYRLIQRLFAEAPKLENDDGTLREGQAPAIECAVMFKGGHGIQGALSETPEGTLRMLVFGQDPKTRELVTVEHFFKYDDVVDIAVPHKAAVTEGSRIHTS